MKGAAESTLADTLYENMRERNSDSNGCELEA